MCGRRKVLTNHLCTTDGTGSMHCKARGPTTLALDAMHSTSVHASPDVYHNSLLQMPHRKRLAPKQLTARAHMWPGSSDMSKHKDITTATRLLPGLKEIKAQLHANKRRLHVLYHPVQPLSSQYPPKHCHTTAHIEFSTLTHNILTLRQNELYHTQTQMA